MRSPLVALLVACCIAVGLNVPSSTPALAGGGGWTHAGPTTTIDEIALDPHNDHLIYAEGPAGLWKSTDAGTTWQQVTAVQTGNIAVNPFNPAELFAAGAKTNASHGARSTDGGVTWTQLAIPIGAKGMVTTILPDRNQGNIVYAGGTDATGAAAIWRSSDEGTTWTVISPANLGVGGYGVPTVLRLVMLPNIPGDLYAAVLSYHSSWVMGSPNAATSASPQWTTIAGFGPQMYGPVPSGIALAGLSNDHVLYGFPGFSRSDNDGAWQNLSSTLPTSLAVIAATVNPGQPNWVYAAFAKASDVSSPQGVYASPDRGQTWLAVDSPGLALAVPPVDLQLVVSTHTLLAATANGIYWKTIVWLPGPNFAAVYSTLDGVRLLGGGLSPQATLTGLPVQYFEKGRIEDHASENPPANWRYMYGLLVDELDEAQVQLPIGGNVSTLTYAKLAALADPAKRTPPPPGYPGYGAFTLADGSAFIPFSATLANEPGHVVAKVFWNNMQRTDLFPGGWLHDLGLPISDAVWVQVTKNLSTGPVSRQILVQGFQRTILTYDPLNPAGWMVERANVGTDYRTAFPNDVGP